MILASRSAQTVTKNPIEQQITITGFEGTLSRHDFLDALFIITMPNAAVHWHRTRQGEVYSATAGSPHYNPFPLLVVQFNLNRSPQSSRRVELFPAAAGGTKTNSLRSS